VACRAWIFLRFFDNTLSASVLASLLNTHWYTLEMNSVFMSATFAGLTIGAALAGLLSDRYGRLFAYQFNLAIFGNLSLICAFAPTMQWLIVLRFVMGIGMGAEYVMGFGLVTEFVPPTHRGRYMGLLALFGGVGVFIRNLCVRHGSHTLARLERHVRDWGSWYAVGLVAESSFA